MLLSLPLSIIQFATRPLCLGVVFFSLPSSPPHTTTTRAFPTTDSPILRLFGVCVWFVTLSFSPLSPRFWRPRALGGPASLAPSASLLSLSYVFNLFIYMFVFVRLFRFRPPATTAQATQAHTHTLTRIHNSRDLRDIITVRKQLRFIIKGWGESDLSPGLCYLLPPSHPLHSRSIPPSPPHTHTPHSSPCPAQTLSDVTFVCACVYECTPSTAAEGGQKRLLLPSFLCRCRCRCRGPAQQLLPPLSSKKRIRKDISSLRSSSCCLSLFTIFFLYSSSLLSLWIPEAELPTNTHTHMSTLLFVAN